MLNMLPNLSPETKITTISDQITITEEEDKEDKEEVKDNKVEEI